MCHMDIDRWPKKLLKWTFFIKEKDVGTSELSSSMSSRYEISMSSKWVVGIRNAMSQRNLKEDIRQSKVELKGLLKEESEKNKEELK